MTTLLTPEAANEPPLSLDTMQHGPGIDARMIRIVRSLIRDDQPSHEFRLGRELGVPEVPNTRRPGKPWKWNDIVTYTQWLCFEVLGIDAADKSARPPTIPEFDRAAKVFDGPSSTVVFNRRSGGMNLLRKDVGFTWWRGKFQDWGLVDLVAGFEELMTANNGRRPGVKEIEEAARNGDFPGRQFVIDALGGISALHELSGRPDGRGWGRKDWLQLVIAFKMQNGPDAIMDHPAFRYLSSKQTAPSSNQVYRLGLFDGLEDFNEQGHKAFLELTAAEQKALHEQRAKIKQLRREDNVFEELTDLMPEEELRRAWGAYTLVRELLPHADTSLIIDATELQSSHQLVDWIRGYRPDLSFDTIKEKTKELDITNTLWPYRFNNANLVVENPKRNPKHREEIDRLLNQLHPETENSPLDHTSTLRRRANRRRRLTRLAARGMKIATTCEDDFIDISTFARKGGCLTADEMAEMQRLIRRGERKAKRLQLFGHTIDADELETIQRDVVLSEDIKTAFVKANIGLANHHVIGILRKSPLPTEDVDQIIQDATKGILKSLEKFEPYRGFKFSTYASWWIRAYAFDSIRQLRRGIQLSHADHSHLRAAYKQQSASNEAPSELSQVLTSVTDVVFLDNNHPDFLSNDATLYSLIPNETDPTQQDDEKERLIRILGTLEPLERSIIVSRFFLDYRPSMPDKGTTGRWRSDTRTTRTYEEVAMSLDITPKVVRLLLTQALQKLRFAAKTEESS